MRSLFEKGILAYAVMSFLLMLIFLVCGLPNAALIVAFIEFSFFAVLGLGAHVVELMGGR